MCLAVPGQLVSIDDTGEVRMGKMNFGGIVKEVCLTFLPELVIGDYAIVHVGFAISQVDEQTARETLEAIRELGDDAFFDELSDKDQTTKGLPDEVP